MKQSDPENELKNVRFDHLTQAELGSYCDQELDRLGLARAEAHLKLCLICDRRLTYLKEERAALINREVTAEDVALIRRAMQKTGLQPRSSTSKPGEVKAGITLPDRMADYLRRIVESWRAHFLPMQGMRGTEGQGNEVWKWQSEDEVLKARAILGKNGDLTIQFSANDLSLESARLKIRIGPMHRKVTLKRVSDHEVYAKMVVPRNRRPKNLADISIEMI
jgi:hypothetical protein